MSVSRLDNQLIRGYNCCMKLSLPLTLAFALTFACGTSAIAGSRHSRHQSDTAAPSTQPTSTSTTDATTAVPATVAPVTSTPATPAAAPTPQPLPLTTPIAIPAPMPSIPLQISQTERDYFEFGYSLSKAAFGYADIAKQSVAIQKGTDHMAQIKQLAALAPAAVRDRLAVRDCLNITLARMRTLHASERAISVVKDAADGLNKPLIATGAAKDLAEMSPDAGKTLASLNEFERISGLTESPDIAAWLKGRHKNRVGNVWYAEGLIAGVAEVASAEEMPELLPTVGEIATDLRGLRDWLQLRMPDPPSRQQAQLSDALDDFLKTTSHARRQDRQVTHPELVALGFISRNLQAEVLVRTASAPVVKPASMEIALPAPKLADDKKPL